MGLACIWQHIVICIDSNSSFRVMSVQCSYSGLSLIWKVWDQCLFGLVNSCSLMEHFTVLMHSKIIMTIVKMEIWIRIRGVRISEGPLHFVWIQHRLALLVFVLILLCQLWHCITVILGGNHNYVLYLPCSMQATHATVHAWTKSTQKVNCTQAVWTQYWDMLSSHFSKSATKTKALPTRHTHSNYYTQIIGDHTSFQASDSALGSWSNCSQVKPVLKTTCIQRPTLFKDHSVGSQKLLCYWFWPLYRDHLY